LTLSPYKNKENNELENKATIAAMVTLLWGILFVGDNDNQVKWFSTLSTFLLIFVNSSFLLNFLFLILLWFESRYRKYPCFVKFMMNFESILFRSTHVYTPTHESINPLQANVKIKKIKKIKKHKIKGNRVQIITKKYNNDDIEEWDTAKVLNPVQSSRKSFKDFPEPSVSPIKSLLKRKKETKNGKRI
jgi:hypothetical protein